jgi:hypothetical protein
MGLFLPVLALEGMPLHRLYRRKAGMSPCAGENHGRLWDKKATGLFDREAE